MTTAWIGDWYQRIQLRVRELGFETATAFAQTQPTASLVDLAKQLGPDDVAAAQLEKVLIHEADEAGTVEQCARDLLVRNIRRRLPEGWHTEWDDSTLGPASRRAGAFAAWEVALGHRCSQCADSIWEALTKLRIPEGWLPEGPADSYILQVFEHWREPE